jgi:hypothetical protein
MIGSGFSSLMTLCDLVCSSALLPRVEVLLLAFGIALYGLVEDVVVVVVLGELEVQGVSSAFQNFEQCTERRFAATKFVGGDHGLCDVDRGCQFGLGHRRSMSGGGD